MSSPNGPKIILNEKTAKSIMLHISARTAEAEVSDTISNRAANRFAIKPKFLACLNYYF